MNIQIFFAYYTGQCYTRAYGRKLYKKGIELGKVCDEQGNVVAEKMIVPKTKILSIFDNVNVPRDTKKISFDAVLNKNRLLYVSNVKIL